MPGHRKRRQFKQTDAFTRGMVIGLKRAGNVAIYRNVGATRVTSASVDRRILRQAVAAPQATCTAILQHVQDTLDHSISTRTISRRLVANGLHSCRPLRRLPLTPPNRRQRLEWCRARSTWMTEWHRVVFSDESRFCLSSDSRRVRVWRRRGERSNPAAIVERPTVRQRGIMVWGAIAYDSRSPLLRIQGTMTAQRYVDDVLRPVTLPYLQGVPNALYQQDNARPHTARISKQALQDVQMLPWPPYSPDLSPIEHVWDIIGRRLHALPQPCSEDELWQMVEREWRAIPQDPIRTLIDSLPRRVAACIAVRDRSEKERRWRNKPAIPTKRPSDLSPTRDIYGRHDAPRDLCRPANRSPTPGASCLTTPTTQSKFPQVMEIEEQNDANPRQTANDFIEVKSFYKSYMERFPRQQENNQRPSFLTEQSSHNFTPIGCLPKWWIEECLPEWMVPVKFPGWTVAVSWGTVSDPESVLILDIATTDEFIKWCQKIEFSHKQPVNKRVVFDRLPNVAAIDLADSESMKDLIRRIVREEVHRALNPESATPEPSSLEEIIREENEKT
ncbi:hypothetical protein LAZ67_8002157 [Cordylochernes scorpioides]|uniref:Transposase n=1 Tax=Cordylochernes scorpioides TaxID=51811 RepID=A0ABY6KQR4_9ARAC|nr:hypothetical protein LAZ67_8002157 [Cordylochernes scorpioides]